MAWIRGASHPEEVLVFSAQLDHPKESANDHASGSAALLDMARTMRHSAKAVEWNDRLAPFSSSGWRNITEPWRISMPIRRWWVDPWGGGYLANLNMDMVGQNLELMHSTMMIRRTPASNPSVVKDVVSDMAAMLDDLEIRTPRGSLSAHNYRVTPYSGGSDHSMCNALHIPGMMLGHTDWAHHTSEDSPDKVDPVQLQRSEMIGLSAFLHLSNLTPLQASLAEWCPGPGAPGTAGVGWASKAPRRLRRRTPPGS